MIKPILYHDFEEKKKIEAELFSKVPHERKLALSKAFQNIFSGISRFVTNKEEPTTGEKNDQQ